MKTQQEAIDDRVDYFDNLNERSPTRPPEQETEKMIAETLRQQPIERTVTILADDYDGLKTICKHYREKCAQITAQRDELLAAAVQAERELEEGVMPEVVAQHLRAVIRERY